jgi:hypothetical protein
MWMHNPPELTKMLQQERIAEAIRANRGLCCASERSEMRKNSRAGVIARQSNLCSC